MAYTTIDNPELYFQTKLYTGNSGTQAITFDGSENMQPDWVWCKSRNQSDNHAIFDSVRGGQKQLRSNSSDAELTRTNAISSFDSNGFSMGSQPEMNSNTITYAAWNWKAGTSVSGTTTGSGTGKAYSGSVNTNAGFSIISYLGNGTAGHTIPHHLGSAPKVVLCKRRTETGQWVFGHGSLGFTKFLELDLTGASQTSTLRWNDTAPTSSVFSVGTTNDTNRNDVSIIAYCFAEKKGYSKFSSWTGTGNADGPFIFTGFLPSLIIGKNISRSEDWFMLDNKRDTFNPVDERLQPNSNGAESTVTSLGIDFCANGFKLKGATNQYNPSGETMIYMAFAESPLVNSNGVPNNAR
jgi:hypothetical protein